MSGDYLWDKQGPKDPEIAELEEVLGALRHEPKPLELGRRRKAPWIGAALAAAALVAVAVRAVPDRGGWLVEPTGGVPVCDRDCRLAPGEWLETEAGASARLQVADIGEMDLGPRTSLRLVETGPDEHKLELRRGVVSARVVAPPRLLVVETPSATAVDLGCAYTLHVDDAGAGELEVQSGWVSLEAPARVVVVPAGARASSRPGIGPGTPHQIDASTPLRSALEAFDFAGDRKALDVVVAEARPEDALTLLYAAARLERSERAPVVDKLLALVPSLAPLGQEALVELGPGTFDAALGLLVGDL